VAYRSVPSTAALAISESVAMADIETWWSEAFEELHQVLAVTDATRTGPDGTLYPEEFFENELGQVVVFIPAADGLAARGRVRPLHLPAAELAVLEHPGAFAELDQAYGELGVFVAERDVGVQGPIREHYVITYSDTR
jgi:effector-binding domain-containing protein